jgi:hypothetical protein
MNNRKQQTDTPKVKDAPLSAFASAEEVSPPPELQRNQRNQQKGQKKQKERGKRATPKDAPLLAFASAEEMSPPPNNSVVGPLMSPNKNPRMAQPGAVAVPGIQLQGKHQKGLALAPAEEVSRLPMLQGARRQEQERRKLKENNEEEDASSDEHILWCQYRFVVSNHIDCLL